MLIYIPLCIYFNMHSQNCPYSYSKFTFHYVSISTQSSVTLENCTIKFTFHYVSISTSTDNRNKNTKTTFTFHYVSISTDTTHNKSTENTKFTFHYVSISTPQEISAGLSGYNLHSTMYLFQQYTDIDLHFIMTFTFHYVSISTKAVL